MPALKQLLRLTISYLAAAPANYGGDGADFASPDLSLTRARSREQASTGLGTDTPNFDIGDNAQRALSANLESAELPKSDLPFILEVDPLTGDDSGSPDNEAAHEYIEAINNVSPVQATHDLSSPQLGDSSDQYRTWFQ